MNALLDKIKNLRSSPDDARDLPDKVLDYVNKHPEVIERIERLVMEFYAPVIYLIILSGIDHIVQKYGIDLKKAKIITFPRDGAIVNRLFPQAINLPFSRRSLKPPTAELAKELMEQNQLKSDDTLIFIDSSTKGGIIQQMYMTNLIDPSPDKTFLITPTFKREIEENLYTFLDTRDFLGFVEDRSIFKYIDKAIEVSLHEPMPILDNLTRNDEGKVIVKYDEVLRSPADMAINAFALDSVSKWAREEQEEKDEIISLVLSGDTLAMKAFLENKLRASQKLLDSKQNPLSENFRDRDDQQWSS